MKQYLPYILVAIALLVAGGIYLESGKKDGQSVLPRPIAQNKKDEAPELKSMGAAPEFTGIEKWLNSDPLTMEQLRGKVVLVDFWTYSCINCIRTLPYVTKWYETYKDQGLVIVGVHTPEFAFEKETKNVQTAIERYKINYPVAQDNDFATWNAYNNRFWPAHYLIDQQGQIVYTHFGEGKYAETENAIRALLGQQATAAENEAKSGDVRTPEIYFGTSRLENLSGAQKASRTPQQYTLPSKLDENTFALEGQWQYFDEKTTLTQGPGKIKLYFYASKVHMVANSANAQTLMVKADDQAAINVDVSVPDLYTLFEAKTPGAHVLEITIPEGGFEAFTFTFG
jgi:thiol-disulfide isomerase/thioredoxin